MHNTSSPRTGSPDSEDKSSLRTRDTVSRSTLCRWVSGSNPNIDPSDLCSTNIPRTFFSGAGMSYSQTPHPSMGASRPPSPRGCAFLCCHPYYTPRLSLCDVSVIRTDATISGRDGLSRVIDTLPSRLTEKSREVLLELIVVPVSLGDNVSQFV
jgi:hypothetical protein